MKSKINILFISILLFSGFLEALGSPPPPKKTRSSSRGTSCSISRTKFTSSDLIDYRFGAIVGLNSATFNTKSDHITDVMFGITGGLAAQIIWPSGFVLQPAIMYSQKGCMLSGSGIVYTIDYVEIPAQLMYRLHISDIKPFAFVAPYGAYALGIKTEGDDGESEERFPTDMLNKLDYGVKLGAGFDVQGIQLTFGYSLGLGQVVNVPYSIRNSVFRVTVGVFF